MSELCAKCGRIVKLIVRRDNPAAATGRRCTGCNHQEEHCLCPPLPKELALRQPAATRGYAKAEQAPAAMNSLLADRIEAASAAIEAAEQGLATARRQLAALARESEGATLFEDAKAPILQAVLRLVEQETGIGAAAIMGRLRSREEVEARHLALWLYVTSGHSLTETGRLFGLHHTSVLHARRMVERKMANGQRERMLLLRESLGG